MWFHCGFEYITTITIWYISQQWLEFVFAVREMSGKSQGFFFCHPRGNPVWINQTHNWSTAAEQHVNLSELFLQHGCGVACQVLNQSNCFQQHGCRADCQTRNEWNIFLLRGNLTSFNHIKPISTERLQRNRPICQTDPGVTYAEQPAKF